MIDPVTQPVFLISSVNEGGNKSLMFGRLKAVDGKLPEIELSIPIAQSPSRSY